MNISDTKKLAAITAAFFITVTAFSGCSESANSSQTTSSVSQAAKSDIDASIAAEDIDVGYDEERSVGITFSDGSAAIDGEGATAEGETVTISQAGTYILSGTATNGRIIVSADKTAEIKLIFNGVDITCADNAPLLVSKAKKVYIVLEDGTENVLTDSASYSLGEDDSNTDGAIFSKADLTINGSGTLTVNANYKHGIVSKDDLVITDGNINVTSASTAMEGKDSVKISGGTFNISAGTNGIKSTNTEASDKGFISVTGGTLIACGAVGMEEGFGDNSTQYSVLHDLGSTVSANEKLTITDSDGKEILSFTPTKTWQSVVFTSADLKKGETYTITAGSQSETVTIDGIVTSNSKGKNFGGGHGGRRGF